MFRLFFRVLIRAYQTFISPFLGENCRFYPSCSEYADESISEYGIVPGVLYSLRRLVKCHPFSLGGYDPVKSHESRK